MSDLIDRQALLDECLNHYEVGNIEQNCTMDWICKTVRNFPPASPWHRVEEKPKEADQYFVIWENNGDRGGGAAWFSLRIGWIWDGPKITHWMPIELPVEVQDGSSR